MKKKLHFLLALVMLVCMMFVTSISASAAATGAQNGIEATISTNQNVYTSTENVEIQVSVSNKNAYDVQGLGVTVELPEELVLKSGELSVSNLNIAAGETFSTDIVAATTISLPEAENSNDTEEQPVENVDNPVENVDNPKTGSSYTIILIAALVVAFAVGVFLTIKSRKKAFKLLSIFLCLVMLGTAVPVSVFATTGDGVDITLSKTVTVSGKDIDIRASVFADSLVSDDESSYQVSFDMNDGSGEIFDVQAVNAGAKVVRPAQAPTRELYRFTGWFLEPAAVTEYDFDTEVTGDFTLYAGWGAPDGSDGLYAATNTMGTIYSVTGITVDENENIAYTTINTNSSCVLALEFFNDSVSANWNKENFEANLEEEPIAKTAVQTPDYGEMITVSAAIDVDLPEYYIIRARLVGLDEQGEVVDLCAPYICIEYTQRYAQFDAQTVENFAGQNVVQFSEDPTDNFGVLNESVQYVYAGEETNVLTVEETDVENEIVPDVVYTFANPDDTIRALRAGDIVYVAGTTYLFKIKTIQFGRDTVSFTPDKDTELSDFYDVLKVDMAPQEANQGIMPMAEIIDVDNTLQASIGGSLTVPLGDRLELTGSLTGSAELQLEITYDFRLFGEDYFYFASTVESDISAEASIEVELASNEDAVHGPAREAETTITLPKAAIPTPIPGVTVYIEPSVPLEWSMTGSASLTYHTTQTKGFTFSTYNGTTRSDKKESSLSLDAKGKLEVSFGPKLAVGIQLLDERVKAELSLQAGVRASATAEIGNDDVTNSAESKHACGLCVSGTAKWFVEAKANLSYKIVKNVLEGDLLDITIVEIEGWINFLDSYPGEFFFSVVNSSDSLYGGYPKFGGGPCQNKSYRTEIVVQDANNTVLNGRPVTVQRQGSNTSQYGNSTCVLYLYNGIYQVNSNVNGATVGKTIIVSSSAQNVTLSPSSKNGRIAGRVQNVQSGEPVSDANVRISKDGLVVATAKSSASGEFSVSVPDGTFLVEVRKGGYVPFSSYESVENAQTTYMQTIQLNPGVGFGGFWGKITDAVTGEPISGVTLQLRSGWNNTSHGDILRTLTTDSNGSFVYQTTDIFGVALGLASGNYTLVARRNGYLETSFNIVVLPGSTDAHPAQNATMSPTMVAEDTYRIVLTWEENPRDLDSHVVGTLSDGSAFHVYYSDKSQYDGDLEVCNLDYDDVSSYGPETITLNTNTAEPYYYYVHHFSGNGTISTSGAKVTVYHGADPVRTFNVPIGYGDGVYWNVFAIVNGQFIVENTITNSADVNYAN